jgi:hypothetical protein
MIMINLLSQHLIPHYVQLNQRVLLYEHIIPDINLLVNNLIKSVYLKIKNRPIMDRFNNSKIFLLYIFLF